MCPADPTEPGGRSDVPAVDGPRRPRLRCGRLLISALALSIGFSLGAKLLTGDSRLLTFPFTLLLAWLLFPRYVREPGPGAYARGRPVPWSRTRDRLWIYAAVAAGVFGLWFLLARTLLIWPPGEGAAGNPDYVRVSSTPLRWSEPHDGLRLSGRIVLYRGAGLRRRPRRRIEFAPGSHVAGERVRCLAVTAVVRRSRLPGQRGDPWESGWRMSGTAADGWRRPRTALQGTEGCSRRTRQRVVSLGGLGVPGTLLRSVRLRVRGQLGGPSFKYFQHDITVKVP